MIRKAGRGFTLVELLIIIMVIAILAAILFPVIVDVREKAHQSTCLNNQRRLAMAITSYAQDNDGRLPLPSEWVSATRLSGDVNVWHCPNSEKKATSRQP